MPRGHISSTIPFSLLIALVTTPVFAQELPFERDTVETHVLESPETFNKYILGSPSLWWDDGLSLQQAEHIAAADTRIDARLFMAAGGAKSESMLSDMAQAAQLLANVDGLTTQTQVISDESHRSVWSMICVRGAKWAFRSSEACFLDAYSKLRPEQ